MFTIPSLIIERKKSYERSRTQSMQNLLIYSKLLNPDHISSDVTLELKNKQYIQNMNSFVARPNSFRKKNVLKKQIRTIPTSKDHYTKRGTILATYDKMVSLKTGTKLLQETTQEETNSKAFFSKFIVYEMLNASISTLSIAAVVIHYEGTFNFEGNDNIYPFTVLLIVLNLLSILLWINNGLYFYDQYKLKVLNRIFPKNENYFKTDLFRTFLIEFFSTLIQPSFFYCGLSYTIKPSFKNEIQIKRTINSILSLFIFTRMYYIGRYLVFRSSYMTPENNEICRKHFFDTNIRYSLIALMKTKPLHIYLTFILSILFVFHYAIKLFESGISQQTQGYSLTNSFHVIWYCIITIFSIGYGDIVAKTDGGRIFAIILSIIGSFLISLFLMGLTNFLVQTPSEKKQFNLLNRIELNEVKFKSADKLIKEFYQILQNKQHLREGIINQDSSVRNFLSKVNKYSNARIDIEHHGDSINDYTFNNVEYGFRYFDKEYQRLNEKDKKVMECMEEVYCTIDKYRNKLKNDSSEKRANKDNSDSQEMNKSSQSNELNSKD